MIDKPLWLSVFSVFVSCIALYFTFKRDAHRVRVAHETFREKFVDTLWINNDGGIPVRIAGVGHVNHKGVICWLDVADLRKNKFSPYPIVVDGRATFHGLITHNIHSFPRGEIYGFVVQLDCGRTYVSVGNLGKGLALSLKIRSLLSWVSSGKLGFEKTTPVVP